LEKAKDYRVQLHFLQESHREDSDEHGAALKGLKLVDDYCAVLNKPGELFEVEAPDQIPVDLLKIMDLTDQIKLQLSYGREGTSGKDSEVIGAKRTLKKERFQEEWEDVKRFVDRARHTDLERGVDDPLWDVGAHVFLESTAGMVSGASVDNLGNVWEESLADGSKHVNMYFDEMVSYIQNENPLNTIDTSVAAEKGER